MHSSRLPRGVLLPASIPILLGLVASPATATCVVAQWTSDDIYIAADSKTKRVFHRPDGSRTVSEVLSCKLDELDGFVFAAAGLAWDEKTSFDLLDVVRDAVGGSESLAAVATALEKSAAPLLAEEMSLLEDEDPEAYRRFLTRPIATIVIARVEEGMPKLAVVDFQAVLSESGEMTMKVGGQRCPEDCASRGMTLLFFGDCGDASSEIQDPAIFSEGPAKAIEKLLEVAAATSKRVVGGPTDLVNVSRDGIYWFARKDGCD